MSNVAEGRTSGCWIRSVDQQDAPSGLGQRPGNGTAHDASADNGDIVHSSMDAYIRFAHLRPVTCRPEAVTYTIYVTPSTERLAEWLPP
jgi:hypothetical protein